MKIATGVSLGIAEFDGSVSPIYPTTGQRCFNPSQNRYESATCTWPFLSLLVTSSTFFWGGWGVGHVSCEFRSTPNEVFNQNDFGTGGDRAGLIRRRVVGCFTGREFFPLKRNPLQNSELVVN